MAYVKTTWQDLPDTTTPITATRLNNIETGVENNDKRLNGTAFAGEMIVEGIRSKNLFGNYTILPGSLENTTMNISGNNRLACIPCKPNTTYTVSRSIKTSIFRVASYSADSLPVPTGTSTDYTVQTVIQNNDGEVITYTTNSSAKWLIIHYGHAISDSNINSSLATIQVETGSTASNYSSYQNLNILNENLINTTECKLFTKFMSTGSSTSLTIEFTNVGTQDRQYLLIMGSSNSLQPIGAVVTRNSSSANISNFGSVTLAVSSDVSNSRVTITGFSTYSYLTIISPLDIKKI